MEKEKKKKRSDWDSYCLELGGDVLLFLKPFCFDAADLHPLNQHLLTVGVHTCIRQSQHKKRPHIKGLSLCLRPAFSGFRCCFLPLWSASSLLWTLRAWADLNRATLPLISGMYPHQRKYTRRDIFTASSVEIFLGKSAAYGWARCCLPPSHENMSWHREKFLHVGIIIYSVLPCHNGPPSLSLCV